MFYPGSDCTSSNVDLFADTVRAESVCRSFGWGARPVMFSWSDLSRRVCIVRHARRYQGAANGNSDYERWTAHVADTHANRPDPLTTRHRQAWGAMGLLLRIESAGMRKCLLTPT